MATLWKPPRVERELREESARREAEALGALEGDSRVRWRLEFNAQLERVMHGMKLMWCPDPAPMDAVVQGAQPGRWHVVWPSIAGGPLNVQSLVICPETGEPRLGGAGGFVEPGSWVFDRLAEADMWNDRSMRERRRIQEEAERAERRRVELEAAEFDERVLEHWRAVSRTQVSMNRSAPWAQTHAGTRRPTRGAKAT